MEGSTDSNVQDGMFFGRDTFVGPQNSSEGGKVVASEKKHELLCE